MHRDDQMTPNQRMGGFFMGKEIDRLPAMPTVISVAGKFAGMTHREKRQNAKNQAESQIKAYEALGHDGLVVDYGLFGIGHACGSKWNDPENDVPSIKEYCLTDLNNINQKLDLEMVTRKKDPWIQLNYEAAEILTEKCGHEVGANAFLSGPFTTAASLYPVDKLLRAARREPEKVHELLRFSTDAIKLVCEEFLPAKVGITICDPLASGDLINEKTYREFVLPYTKEIFAHLFSLGAGGGYHICGDTNKILEAEVESGCGMLSVDTKVNLADAKKRVGDRIAIMGNVDPIHVMLRGTPEDVENNIKQNLRDCWDSPRGFALSTGCDLPINTPLENICAFMDSARKVAKWPVDPERFM